MMMMMKYVKSENNKCHSNIMRVHPATSVMEHEGLRTESEGTQMMSDVSSFHKLVPKTGYARLTTVVRQKYDTAVRRLKEADLSSVD